MTSSPAVQADPVRPLPPAAHVRPGWLPVWSKAAAMRAVRATVVVPGMFALGYTVIGDLQLATFAAFGGFATLVLAAFGGGWRDKLLAHLGLAVTGSVLLVIGTAVNSSIVLASLVTIPVAFVVLFAGVGGPNAASAGTAALLAYVLPAASPGTMSMVPERLEGWWLASVAGTIAVLVFSPRLPGFAVRTAAARSARALAGQLEASLRGDADSRYRTASIEAKHELMATFTSTPYRPTGLATADQALDSLVGLLEWCTFVVTDSLREYGDLRRVPEVERQLLADTSAVLRAIGDLLDGQRPQVELGPLERSLAASVDYLARLSTDGDGYAEALHLSFHARTTAVAAHTAMADTLIAVGRAEPDVVSGGRRRWYGQGFEDSAVGERRLAGLATAAGAVSRHASLRSVWFLNSARGALALAAAVAVADLTGVEHGFWVVLGTLSVLRTNAASTGATALRALLGTAIGFVLGALLLLVVGTGAGALWIALPVAVLVAAYAPGALPFAAGQAAFTVVVSVLYNLLVPAGWQIGVVRIEDVALGCGVSIVVGVLFWPRGAASLVGDDLADALRTGGAYLAEAADWALGLRHTSPVAAPAITAGVRLDDALRGFLTEQGAKRVPREDLWRLVAGTVRVRLTAHSLAGLPNPEAGPDPVRLVLSEQAGQLAAWYDHLASRLDRTDHGGVPVLSPPEYRDPLAEGVSVGELSCALWVSEHLKHLTPRLAELVGPATVVAAQRHRPWWR
ncbi:FUSC family protein [Amycolatopsis acidiphila]|uniref:FUSC family protein n=1 Tax=Amycolatopsis acidiphila TaxID=715473 RepID=A0A558ACP6_9PSEU|nr:FUSC family protein [Amycolatopsis acidiphila]TVT22027.1 FUSC family protein [Amycolatopsis acidiphila]GHG67659.1 FUSC family protein [Amycolatopsis acidiphila]